MLVLKTKSAEETQALAKQLLPLILNKNIVQLSGPLGSGKTTFVKGLALALGIEDLIKSPTYTYLNRYEITKAPKNSFSPFQGGNIEQSETKRVTKTLKTPKAPKALTHFDLYRLPEQISHPEQTKAEIGLEEALNNPNNLVIIEWAERLPIENNSLHIKFRKQGNEHIITLSKENSMSK